MKPPRHGEQPSGAKLTEADVLAIRKASVAGVSVRQLGKQYGVSQTAVWKVATGRTWRHVKAVEITHAVPTR